MKTRLTLEDIAPYLPYGLKAYIFPDDFDLTSAVKKHKGLKWYVEYDLKTFDGIMKDGYKPIFRPMDLKSPITIDGKKVMPLEEISNIIDRSPVVTYLALQWLFKHKFDVLGLIELGLAIDVNTLEINPYNQ